MNAKLALTTAFFLATLATRTEAADPPSPSNDATAEKQRGDQAMDALRFDEAVEAYTHSYELGHDPAVLYNRGRLYQARSEWTKALDDLETFDREASPALKAKVPKLAQLLEEVRAHVATLTLKCPVPGAQVVVRGAAVGTTPIDALRVNAGPAKIEVTAEGYAPFTSEASLAGGVSTVLDVVLTPKGAATGTLIVTASGPRATVLVDGERIGIAPIELLRPAGTHKVVVKRDAADDAETSALLVAGGRKEVHFDAPPSRGLTSQWWFWTGIGVAAVAAAVTVILVTGIEKSPANGDGFSPTRVSAPLRVQW